MTNITKTHDMPPPLRIIEKWFTKQSVIIFIMLTTLLITSCGFHLQSPNMLSPQLHTLYLEDNTPYNPLTQQLRDTLKTLNIKLVCQPNQAPFTLEILSITQTPQLISKTTNSVLTRPYLLQSNLTYMLKRANGDIIISPTTLTTSRHFILPGNVLLNNSDEKNIATQETQEMLIERLLNKLSSDQVREKLFHANDANRC